MSPSDYNANQITLLAVVSICFGLAILSVVLRFLARRLIAAPLLWDDWCALLALGFSALTNALIYISITAGLGRHVGDLSPDELLRFGLTFYVQELSWTVAMAFIVLAILAFYQRLFQATTWLRYAIYAMVAFTVAWAIATFLTLVFQCTPVPYAWDRSIPGGYCVPEPLFFVVNGTISTITVFLVLLLPVPVLWNLQVSRSKKVGLIVPFTIGSFVCAMSVARLIAIHHLDNNDLPWSLVFPGMWSCVETNIGVTSACVPSFTPLLRHLAGKRPARPAVREKRAAEGIVLALQSDGERGADRSESCKGLVLAATVELPDGTLFWAESPVGT